MLSVVYRLEIDEIADALGEERSLVASELASALAEVREMIEGA